MYSTKSGQELANHHNKASSARIEPGSNLIFRLVRFHDAAVMYAVVII